MRINQQTFHHIILIVFIYSKFFYHSLLQVGQFNFTLSDFCLGAMLLTTINSRIKMENTYRKIIAISIIIIPIFTIGSLIQGGSITSGLIIYIKRWLSLLVIPIYISVSFKKNSISLIVYYLIGIVFYFSFLNWNELLQSIKTTRFFDTFNPNILGMTISLILIFILNYRDKHMSPGIKGLIYFICVMIIIAVSSRGALLALIPVLLIHFLFKLKRITYKGLVSSILVIIVVFVFLPNIINATAIVFPYSYSRILNTFQQSIVNDPSASSRLNTQATIVGIMKKNIYLALFGTGFGNENMFFTLFKYGYGINTADSMYVNMLAWSGIIGLILFMSVLFMILKRIVRLSNNVYRDAAIQITLFMLFAGIASDTFMEPTIGAIYFVFLGIYEICNVERIQSKYG